MSSFHNNALVGASGQAGYQIERSLRFNSPDSAFLSRAFGSDGGSTWTISCWLKRSEVDTRNFSFTLMHAGAYPNPYEHVQIGNNQIIYYNDGGASSQGGRTTSAVFRDCSAWYHIVCVRQGTSQFKIYVNGVEQAAASNTNPSASYALNKAATMYIGQNNNYDGAGIKYSAGYLTEYHFVSGQALTPSSFGETDLITGVWKPKKYAGTYGTNGFFLKFADNSGTTSTTLGKDSSGNSNNWTPNNFSVTAGAGNDSMIDTPTPYADGGNGRGNYCTLNPLTSGSFNTLSNGNLDVIGNTITNNGNSRGTIIFSTGKWYAEMLVSATAGTSYPAVGIIPERDAQLPDNTGTKQVGYVADSVAYENNGQKRISSTTSSYGASYTTNDVIGVAIDADNGAIYFSKNGTYQNSGDPTSGASKTGAAFTWTGGSKEYVLATAQYNGSAASFNFGQRAFAYTPPSGFLALNTQNLPEPSIKKPSSYFDIKLYSGTNANQSITGLGFSPDLIWFKNRTGTAFHGWFDSVRGRAAGISSNVTDAESTSSAGNDLVSFDANGFSLGPVQNWNSTNGSGNSIVAWCWDESATPGFDIVTYTGNSTAGRTVSHSLGVAPSMIITKTTSTSLGNWGVYHSSLGATNVINLNKTDAASTSSVFWNNTAPSSTVFTVGTSNDVNGASNYVAYLWSEVAGFSKFGSYTGNGSSDGPFVFTGHRSRWIMIKRTSSTANWRILDTARDTYNIASAELYPNLSNAEASFNALDINSNGFKIRNTDASYNASGGTYIFAAFAESPFKYSLAR